MQVLLTHAVPHFGQPGDLVKVRPGFARNYLLPQGLATFATPHNLRIVEKHRERLRELEEARRTDLVNLAAQIAQRSITIEANANAEGHLYGSVNADQIAAALKADNFPIDAENVKIEGPLKELGLYTIKLSLGQDVDTEVKLWVVPTHVKKPPPEPARVRYGVDSLPSGPHSVVPTNFSWPNARAGRYHCSGMAGPTRSSPRQHAWGISPEIRPVRVSTEGHAVASLVPRRRSRTESRRIMAELYNGHRMGMATGTAMAGPESALDGSPSVEFDSSRRRTSMPNNASWGAPSR